LSRSLLGFLLFCLLLVLASTGVVWYMGPTLAGIVVDSDRRDNTYYLLQLLPAAAASAGDQPPSYRSRFVTLAAADRGRLLWQGGGVEVIEGSLLLDVAGAQVMEFASGGDLVQMLTSSAYRTLESGSAAAPVRHLGSSQPPDMLATDAATVVVLYRADAPGRIAPLGVPGDSGWLALLPRYQGRVCWDAPIDAIRGPGSWQRVLFLQFPELAAAEAWLADPDTVTERAIAGRSVDAMLVLLVQASMAAPQ
jgi:uncharacterized protein (DUF1330 family)